MAYDGGVLSVAAFFHAFQGEGGIFAGYYCGHFAFVSHVEGIQSQEAAEPFNGGGYREAVFFKLHAAVG